MRRRAFTFGTLGVLAAASVTSCAIPNRSGEVGAIPDSKSFIESGVSTFMERRCGSLDCHGQVGRPLRLYSDWGLRYRARADGSRDNGPTTNEEQLENYRSVVGLEPENLARCFNPEDGFYDTFQLLLKPLGIEGNGIRHKGGPVLRLDESDPGWLCLYNWACGTADRAACEQAKAVR